MILKLKCRFRIIFIYFSILSNNKTKIDKQMYKKQGYVHTLHLYVMLYRSVKNLNYRCILFTTRAYESE